MKKIGWIILAVSLVASTMVTIYWIFGTSFARATVDWFAIFAGIFLIVEGAYKIAISKEPFFPPQVIRAARIVIGACIFTVHVMLRLTR